MEAIFQTSPLWPWALGLFCDTSPFQMTLNKAHPICSIYLIFRLHSASLAESSLTTPLTLDFIVAWWEHVSFQMGLFCATVLESQENIELIVVSPIESNLIMSWAFQFHPAKRQVFLLGKSWKVFGDVSRSVFLCPTSAGPEQ